MLSMPADRLVHSLDHAVAAALAGARRAFEVGMEEYACHLVLRDADVPGDAHAVVTIGAPDDRSLFPHNTLRIARICAAQTDCIAIIWVIPGCDRDEGMSIGVEQPRRLQTWSAEAGSLVQYSLEAFVAGPARDIDQYDYLALPANVVAYADRFGLDSELPHLGPTDAELAAARASLARRSRKGGR